MKYNEPPIKLKMALHLKYILYIAGCADTQTKKRQEENREKARLARERGEEFSYKGGSICYVGLLRQCGYNWSDYKVYKCDNKYSRKGGDRSICLVKCKMNDNKEIYVYGSKYANIFKNEKCFQFSLKEYMNYRKIYRAVVKAFKIMRRFKYDYENKIIKLVADYIDKRKMDKKQACPICKKIMNKSSIKRHINSQHK